LAPGAVCGLASPVKVGDVGADRRLTVALLVGTCLSPGPTWAADFPVTTGADSGPGSLRQAIFDANAAGGTNTITINVATITLSQSLPMITASVTVIGNNATLDAQGNGRAFFVQAGTVAISNLTIDNAAAVGGAGGTGNGGGGGGGGGLGAGAAVFVNSGANVSLTNVTVGNASATGGTGGDGGGGSGDGGAGGGGGLGGGGGNTTTQGAGGGGGYAGAGGGSSGRGGGGGGGDFGAGCSATGDGGGGGGGQQGTGGDSSSGGSSGGGGGGGATANGQNAVGTSGGAGGAPQGGNGGNLPGAGAPASAPLGGGGGGSAGRGGGSGLLSGGGGGGGVNAKGNGGGVGGGGGGSSNQPGAGGGDFAGGGASVITQGGSGGFGGGGGASGGANGGTLTGFGGQGGFGAGGGAGGLGGGGGGTFGGTGGSGLGADGGGGAALGGAVFVRDGGSLTIDNGSFTGSYGVTGGATAGGGGATAGQAQGTTMYLNGSGTTTFSGTQTLAGADALAGTGTLGKSGAGTLTVTSANTNFTGDVSVTGGTLSISSDANLGNGGTVNLAEGTTLAFTAGGTYSHAITVAGDPTFDVGTGLTVTQSGAISDGATPGTVEKTGDGILVLNAENSYSGGTTIAAGTVRAGDDSALGTGAVDMTASGTLLDLNNHTVEIAGLDGVSGSQVQFDASGNLSLDVANGASHSFAGNLVGTSGGFSILAKSGAGTQTLSGDNTVSGVFSVQQGTLSLDSNTAMSSNAFLEVVNGAQATVNGVDLTIGELVNSGDPSGEGTVDLNGGSLTVAGTAAVNSFAGHLTGSGDFIVNGSGGLIQTLSGTSDYTGDTKVEQGTLQAGADNSFSAASAHTISSGATLDLAGHDETIGSLAGAGDVTLGAGVLTTGGAGGSEFSGQISGGGGIVKAGSSDFTLSGTNLYTGDTNVNGGTLSISSDANLGNGGTVNLAEGTTLSFLAGGTYTHAITVAGDPTFDTNGNTVTENGQITDATGGPPPGEVLVTGGDTLVLGNALNSYSGGTTVIAGSTVSVAVDGDLGATSGGVALGDATTAGTLATTGSFSSGRTLTLAAGGGTVDTTAAGVTTELSGQVTGTGLLTKTGAGTLILSGSNDHSGGTTVSGGTLQGTAATLTGDITDNANVTFDQATDGSYGNVVSGSGSLTKIGSAKLTLSGTNLYSGGTNVDAGTLSISSDANLGTGGTVALAAGTTLDFTAGGTYAHAIAVTGDPTFNIAAGQTVTQNGQINDGTGPGDVEVTGGGTLVLGNAANGYSGGTGVTQGSTVSVAASGALGTGGVTLGDAGTSGTLATTGSFTTLRSFTLEAGGGIFDTASGVTTTLSGNVGGAGSLTKTGDGTLDLTGSNNHNGGTIVNGGTLEGTTATLTGDITDNANVTFNQTAGGSYGNVITGSGSVTKIGSGTVTFTAANGYTGGTEVDAGTLQLGSGGSLAATTALTVNGGSFDIENTVGQTVGSLSGTGGSVTLGNGGLTVDQTAATATSYAGSIGGSFGLTKSGVGTLGLTGTSNYTGATEVDAGTLQLGSGGNLAATTALIVNGGIFDLNNHSQTVSSLSGAGGTVDLGSGALTVHQNTSTTYAGTITGDGSLSMTGFGTLILTGPNNYSGGTTVTDGRLQGTTVSLQGDIAVFDNGTVVFDQNTEGTYAGRLSGSGTLIKAGSGTLILTGNNTNIGGNVVTGGTLQGSTSSLHGTIFLDGDGTNVTFDQATDGTYDSIIEGVGSLTKTGSGTLILTGFSSFAGGTTVSAGTLQITTESLTGAIVDDANVTFDQNTDGIFDTRISGSGSVTKNGSGTVALGNGSYTGGTIVNAGVLQLDGVNSLAPGGALTVNGGSFDLAGHSQTVGSLSGAGGAIALTGATLTVNQNPDSSFAGVISGGGSLSKSGAGTLSLTGASGYTGATTVSEGRLELGSGGSLAATTALIVNGGSFDIENGTGQTIGSLSGTGGAVTLGDGSLTVNQSATTSFAGSIGGTGGLSKSGAGILALTGASSYTGDTTVSAGTLTLGAGGSLASTTALIVDGGAFGLENGGQTVSALSGAGGAVTLGNGTLTVNQSITTSFLGDISGSGGLSKTGTGTLILDGVNDYTGLTSVNNGTLEIGDAGHTTASLAGPVTIGADGTLAGHGTIGGDVANSDGGALSPGGSIGTLTLGGNYSQGPTSSLLIEVSPTAASQLHVLGNASLDGTLALVYEPGVYSDASYDVLKAASLSGTFASVTGTAPTGFTQSVTYSPTDVTLDLASGSGPPVIVAPTNDTIFTALSTAALLAAQQANGALLTHMGELHLGTGSPKVQTALASTAPTQVAFAGTADQLADLLPEIPQAVGQMGGWFKAIGSFASLDGSITTPGFDTQAGGFLAGFDKAVSSNLTVGIAAGYLHTNLSEAGGASGSIDTPRLAVYGTYTLGNFAVDATAGYAYDFIDSSRPFASLGQTASSSYNGQEANAALQVSTRANFAGITFMPAAGLAFVHVAQTGVSESGAPGFNLNVNGNGANSLRPFIGLTAAKSYTTDGGTVITPEADIAYSYETLNTTPPSLVQVGGGSFTVPGLMPSRSQLTLGGGVTAQLTDTLAFEAAYHITPPTGNLLSQTISLGLDYRF
jgi:fibronectin-binding autotransporter adhesin